MKRSDCRRLIDLGRKAGLNTSEIYGALSGADPRLKTSGTGSDGNGFKSGFDSAGHQIYLPATRGRAY